MTEQARYSQRSSWRMHSACYTFIATSLFLNAERANADDSPANPRDSASDPALDPTSAPPSPPPPADDFQTVAPGEIVKPGESVAPNHRAPEPMRFGVVGGVGFPRPVSINAFLQFDRHWSIGGEFSMLPVTDIANVNTNFWACAADARLYPFHGAFYIGLKTGYQYLGADGYLTTSGVKALAQGSVNSVFVNPEIGFLFTWDSGMALGFGAGLQIPIYADSTTTTNIPLSADILSTVGKLGTGVLPTVDLLRVGLVL